MTALKTYTRKPESGEKPEQLVILLHGLGSDGRDLIGLAPHFAQALPEAVFVSPDAPFPCDMAPMGYQWFSLQEWMPESILKGVKEAAPVLDDYIAAQIDEHGVPAAQTALVGFSQGTMMSLYAGPRYQEKLAGVLGYSGALIEDSDSSYESANKIPVYLRHGDADPVVPVSAFHHAMETLKDAGFDVKGDISPGLGHGIDPEGISAGQAFLQRIFS